MSRWLFFVGGTVAWLAVAGFPHSTQRYFYTGLLSVAVALGYLVTYLWGPVAMFPAFVVVAITAGVIANPY